MQGRQRMIQVGAMHGRPLIQVESRTNNIKHGLDMDDDSDEAYEEEQRSMWDAFDKEMQEKNEEFLDDWNPTLPHFLLKPGDWPNTTKRKTFKKMSKGGSHGGPDMQKEMFSLDLSLTRNFEFKANLSVKST